MPALPGDQVARRFRQLHPASILVLTIGWDIEENYGNLDFLTCTYKKSVEPETVDQTLAQTQIIFQQHSAGSALK